jgi:hypothetical protein
MFSHCRCHSSQPQLGRLGTRRAIIQEYEMTTSTRDAIYDLLRKTADALGKEKKE